MVVLRLAQWISPKCGAIVSKYMLRLSRGDIDLVPEITARYDALHGTTTAVLMKTVSNEVLEMERANAAREKALELENQEFDARERQIVIVHKELVNEREKIKIESEQLKNEAIRLDMRATEGAEEDAELRRFQERLKMLKKEEDPQLRAAIKDSLVNTGAGNNPNGVEYQTKDMTTLAAEVGLRGLSLNVLGRLGTAVSKEFRKRYPNRVPAKVQKSVNSATRSVNVYEPADPDWIRALITKSVGDNNGGEGPQ